MKRLTLIALASLILATSCRTTKYVDRVEYRQDSTYIKQNESLQALYRETVEGYEKRLEESTGITIEYRDTGRIDYLPGKVIYKDGGFEASGELKNVKVSNTRLAKDNALLRSRIDSLSSLKDSTATAVRVEYKTVTKEVVRNSIPWWMWLLLILTGAAFTFKNRVKFLRWLSV